jgi:hypothetical protein
MTEPQSPARTAAVDAIVASVQLYGRAATARIGAQMAVDIAFPLLLAEVTAAAATDSALAATAAAAMSENVALRAQLLRAQAVIRRASQLAVNASWNLPELRATLDSDLDDALLEEVIAEDVLRRMQRHESFAALRLLADELGEV